MHFYITGDTHRDFDRIEEFCEENATTVDDVMIILGDAGINYYCGGSDCDVKAHLSRLNITLFCVHGNHEERPWLAADYDEVIWNEGIVYVESQYPNILFAKDGEIYNFHGKKVMPIGGAYSVDKYYRLRHGLQWFESEQPDEDIKAYVEAQLDKVNWSIDVVLSHAVPIEAEPVWAFIPGLISRQWTSPRKSGYSIYMIIWIFLNGTQDITTWKVKNVEYESCLKIMMKSVRKNNGKNKEDY